MKTVLLFAFCVFTILAANAEEKYTTDPNVVSASIVGQWHWNIKGKDSGDWVVFEKDGIFIRAGERHKWKVSPSGIITVTREDRKRASVHLSADQKTISGVEFANLPVTGERRK